MRLFLVRLAYNVLLHLLFPAAFLVSRRRHRKRGGAPGDLAARLGLSARAWSHLPRDAVWVQAVSVGEAAAARPVVDRLSRAGFGPLFLTVTTATGSRVAGNLYPGLPLTWFPFDLPLVWRLFLGRVRPRLFIAMETELWPNLLAALRRRRIPAVILNGRLSERSYRRYRRVRFFLRPLLRGVACFGMRGAGEAAWIIALGAPPERVAVTGNLKYDQALYLASGREKPPLPVLGSGARALMFASFHPGEEAAVLAAAGILKAEFPGLKFIFAPRHPERGRLAARLAASGFSARPFSALRPPLDRDALVVDVMGVLGGLYPLAAGVFVGGTLVPAGGQNMLEPAAFGRPLAFGPHVADFREEAALLLERRAACLVRDGGGLADFFRRLLAGDPETLALGERARAVVAGQAGAAERSLALVRRAAGMSRGRAASCRSRRFAKGDEGRPS